MFTSSDALRLLRKAVHEVGPDFVYPDRWRDGTGNCQYVLPGGTAACLVGKALELGGYDLLPVNPGPGEYLDMVVGAYEYEAMEIFALAQEYQDELFPWGFVLDEAEKFAKARGITA